MMQGKITKYNEFIVKMRERFQYPVPGNLAQELMAPSYRYDFPSDPKSERQSGVLVLFYPKDEKVYFVLMERGSWLRMHSGQISLPGGKMEKADASYYETALRETNEELGVKIEDIHYLGALTPLFIPVSNFMVHPFVAFAKTPLEFVANKSEVAKIIEVSLEDLLNDACRKEECWKEKGKLYVRPYYEISEVDVWGATAMILSELRSFITRE